MFTPLDNMPSFKQDVTSNVLSALNEDLGTGDITAQLIPANKEAEAYIITREDCIVCGRPWVDEVFRQLDPTVEVTWLVEEGQSVTANTRLFQLKGNARILLSGERAALNFLQLLSGTASKAAEYAKLVEGTEIKILDTRKTIPGLRTAQKYAVKIGGCENHRIGLFDAFLIKENHIAACGGISQAVTKAHEIAPGKAVEVEVESLEELQLALDAGADIVMLDNFSIADLEKATELAAQQTKLEISGNIEEESVNQRKHIGVDFMSTGALTKHAQAVDLSMRFYEFPT